MQNEASMMLIFKCRWYDLLNSKMVSIRRINLIDREDILFQMSSHCPPLSSIVLPVHHCSSLVLPVQQLIDDVLPVILC